MKQETETGLVVQEERILEVLSKSDDTDIAVRREKIFQLEDELKSYPKTHIVPTHRFVHGMYMREITMPKGTLLTGRIHKFDHFEIMMGGDVSITDDDGTVHRKSGYHIMIGKVGKKRAIYCHKDTTWVTVHLSERKSPQEMYKFLTADSFEEVEEFHTQLNKLDYQMMIEQMGLTDEQVRESFGSEADIYQGDFMSLGFVGPSKIEGKGYISETDIKNGVVISKAVIDGKRTEAGRFVNHGKMPNALMFMHENGDIDLIAIRDIPAGEEITSDYRTIVSEK